MKSYDVTISMRFPSWSDRPFTLTISAANAKDAISRARRQIASEGNFDRHDGGLTYRAARSPE